MSSPDPSTEVIRTELHFGNRLLRCFAGRPANLLALFDAAFARHPNADALVDERRRLDYAGFQNESAAAAGNLSRLGLVAGDRIVLLTGNCVEFAVLALAAWRLGAVIVPLNPRNVRDEVGYVMGQCGARAIAFEASLSDRVPAGSTTPGCTLRLCVDDAGYRALLAPVAGPATHRPAEDDVAVLLYTSGTTGRPKGAMLTHLNMVHSVMHFHAAMKLVPGDRSLLAVPISHVTGLVAIFLTMVGLGGATIMIREFKAPAFLEKMVGERATHTLVVPAIYNLLLRDPAFEKADLSAWRIGGFGGAPMPEPTIEALARTLPSLMLVNGYGATETTSPTTVMPLGEQIAHLDSVGKVVACGDVLVMDDAGRQVASGESGELWIGGPMVVPGYWDNPEATAREFAGGYWKSGDIGSIDAMGFVRVFDRKKDMINRAGYKVYSAEVESALIAHPSVIEAAVIGQPDPVLGEKTHAHVVMSGAADAAQLRAHCAQHLADYKIPDFFTFRTEPLPRNPNGKVLKRHLRG
jgi:long-chain acyl-CoA synthetase